MSPLLKTLMKFSKTRQGRKLTQQAMTYARSPQAKKQLAQVQAQLAKKKRR